MPNDSQTPGPPCRVFEDGHVLVVNKPAGMNTHAPGPFAGEGIYDWLRHRELRWADLAIIHRLDKETSGLIVFGKTPLANRSLTAQFTRREVRKKYLLLTDRPVRPRERTVESKLVRAGDRYASGSRGEPAQTRFHILDVSSPIPGCTVVEAEPFTGRSHQIRVHAAESGFPVLGDTLYGGSPFRRLCLHAAELRFQHPASENEIVFQAPPDFTADIHAALRSAIIESADSYRVVHGAADGWPGWYVDRWGNFLLSQSEGEPDARQRRYLESLPNVRGAYHKVVRRPVGRPDVAAASPRLLFGRAAPAQFPVTENGVVFEISFNEGGSVGLFDDQRDNRRRLLSGHMAAGFPLIDSRSDLPERRSELLNTFAYTCGFSVCAAKAGLKTVSVDLSKKSLDWGRRNFALNRLDPAEHEFIAGDVFEWLRRFARRQRSFDVVILDPPTFSQSKSSGAFRAESDYGRLAAGALRILRPGGVLFASSNASGWTPPRFLRTLEDAVHAAGRRIVQQFYAPQPPDFPISRQEPAYLKTAWMRIA